jgi:hypothetical protein
MRFIFINSKPPPLSNHETISLRAMIISKRRRLEETLAILMVACSGSEIFDDRKILISLSEGIEGRWFTV